MDARTLIDKASEVCGGQNALARRVGASTGTVSEWRSGKRACPVKHIAEMAELIGAPNVAEVVGQVELARAGNPSGEARRGVRRGVVATLRGWLAVAAAAAIVGPGSERHIDYSQLATADDV